MTSKVVVRTRDELAAVIDANPFPDAEPEEEPARHVLRRRAGRRRDQGARERPTSATTRSPSAAARSTSPTRTAWAARSSPSSWPRRSSASPPPTATGTRSRTAGDGRRLAACSTRAATTPPIAPNRWPCHEMPGVGHEPESSVVPVDRQHDQRRPRCARRGGCRRRARRGRPRSRTRGRWRRCGRCSTARSATCPSPPTSATIAVTAATRAEAAERDRGAEHEERDRVADQVVPAGVQERREHDPRPGRRPRAAGSRRSRARRRRRRRPRRPHHADHRPDEDDPRTRSSAG